MSRRERLTHKAALYCGTAIVVIGTLVVCTQTGFAAQDKCQAGLEKAASRFATDLKKNLAKCADAVAKAQTKGTAVAKAAATCEKALQSVYDAAGTKGSSSVTKFRTACSNLTASGKCASSDLTLGNYLLSGPDGEAPPATGDIGKFTCDWLLLATEKAATEEEFFAVPNMLDLLSAAVSAPESQPGKGDGTTCSDPSARGFRPNLCQFGIECHQVACQLDNSGPAPGASLFFIGGAASSITGRLILDECQVKGTFTGAVFGVDSNFLYLVAQPAQALLARNTAVNAAECVYVLRGQGWCDCNPTGAGVHVNPNLCQDRMTNDNASGTDDCGVSVSLATADPNFPGTRVGRQTRNTSGASGAGDCFILLTLSFIGLDTTGFGPDGIPCTNDDIAPVVGSGIGSLPLALTTGTAQATLKEGVQTPGGCSGNAGAKGCIEDANCSAANGGPGGTCSAPAPIPLSASTLGPMAGSAGSCANYEAGNLENVTFVAATPYVGPPGSASVVSGLRLKCQ